MRLSWLLGFKALGFQVFFVEQIAPEICVDAAGEVVPFQESANLAYFRRVAEEFGLGESATLIYGSGEETSGLPYRDLQDLASDADLLVNISGHLTLEPMVSRIRRKVYVDIDPGFTQFWHQAGSLGSQLAGHDFYYTIGENIGTPGCPVPVGGIEWRPIRQPVVLADWPVSPAGDSNRFTTVANWRGGYGRVEYEGKTYGLKVHEFRKFVEVPRLLPGLTFEIALNIHPADHRDLDSLLSHNWKVVDSALASEPAGFRDYVRGSGAEFSVAQGIYVETASGWFSDRTVRYLACGKPVLAQDTGFSRNLPTGEGLLAFNTLDDVVTGVNQIASAYQSHCQAARMIAEEYFDSAKVLGRLAEEVGVAP